jgi:hypothetical protein
LAGRDAPTAAQIESALGLPFRASVSQSMSASLAAVLAQCRREE